jgi:hypothetical protein
MEYQRYQKILCSNGKVAQSGKLDDDLFLFMVMFTDWQTD